MDEKNLDEKNTIENTHALSYWTTERMQTIDIAQFYSGKVSKMRESNKPVALHTTKVCTVLILFIKDVCA